MTETVEESLNKCNRAKKKGMQLNVTKHWFENDFY